jgi:hypothetical protein
MRPGALQLSTERHQLLALRLAERRRTTRFLNRSTPAALFSARRRDELDRQKCNFHKANSG